MNEIMLHLLMARVITDVEDWQARADMKDPTVSIPPQGRFTDKIMCLLEGECANMNLVMSEDLRSALRHLAAETVSMRK